MKYTVQCQRLAYLTQGFTVEADSVEEACQTAITVGEDDCDNWHLEITVGPVFVVALCEGENQYPWTSKFKSKIPVPEEYEKDTSLYDY